jgi:hypothetical protein
MKTKLAGFVAILSLSFVFIPFLFAQGSGDENKVQFSTPVFTQTEIDYSKSHPDYFTIQTKSIRVIRQEVKEEADMSYVMMNECPSDKDGMPVATDNIINIASKIWGIISNNAPTVNIDTKYAVAYPIGITAAAQMSQWSKPKSYVYGFYANNLYGMRMIDVEYKVTYTYGGAYKGGGKYLTAVTVIPTKVDVGWGYKFSMNAAVPDSTVTNVGTHTSPVAAMQLKLSWKISTVLKESDGASMYYVQGDGYFAETASPFQMAYPFAKTLKIEAVNSARPLLEGKKIFE